MFSENINVLCFVFFACSLSQAVHGLDLRKSIESFSKHGVFAF